MFLGQQARILAPRKNQQFVDDGTDEIALAPVTDAYSHTALSEALIVSKSNGPVRMRDGLNIIPNQQAGTPNGPKRILLSPKGSAQVTEFDRALLAISVTYATASIVALQLEHPQS